MRKLVLFALLVLASAFLGTSSALAQGTLTYTNGDLFLGVRASEGSGAGQDYLVKIGQASQFTGATGSFTVPNLGNIAADLTTIFGPDWNTRSDVFWSVSGGNTSEDPENTLYVTREEPTGSRAIAWIGNSPSAQGVVNSRFRSLATAYKLGAVAPNSSVATVQNTADSNSYASFQPGGTTANSNGQSFAAFSPSIEASFAETAPSSLGLFRVLPNYGQYSQDLGSFTLSANGTLTFTPAPTQSSISFTSAQFSVDEDTGSGRVYLTFVRSGNLASSVTAEVSTTPGTAANGVDYTEVTNASVSFAPYVTQATVEVPITVRPGIQQNRNFSAALANASAGASIGTNGTATITIVESETLGGKLNFTFNSYQKTEGASTDVTLGVNITRTNGQTGPASVQVVVSGGTATSADYAIANATATWADGDSATKTVDITIKTDGVNEPIETLVLQLQNATGAVVGAKGQTTVSILDGTPAVPGTVTLVQPSFTFRENAIGNATAQVTATRSSGTNAVSVDVVVTGGTASSADYTFATTTLSWAAGESGSKTFPVTIKADSLLEGEETVILALQNGTGGVTIGSPSSITLTINDPLDNTAPTLTLTAPKANAKLSGTTVAITGVATDELVVSRVEVALNGGSPQVLTPQQLDKTFSYSTSVAAEPGANTVVVKAFDGNGNASAALTRTFSFTLVRAQLAGKYNGLLVAANGAPVTKNGLVALTVTSTGAFTGKVSLEGVALPIKGTFGVDGTAKFGTASSFELKKKVGKNITSLGFLALSLDTGAGKKVTGTLQSATTGEPTLLATIPHADLAVYTAKKNPAAPLMNVPVTLLDLTKEKGKYTSIFQAVAAPNNGIPASGYPQGDGYGTLSISTAGVVKVVGKLADGSAISYSNTLSADGKLPVYLPLYKNGGFIAGEVSFANEAQSDALAENGLLWVKPAVATDKVYPAGWPNGITVDFAASKYIAPGAANPGTVFGPQVPVGSTLNIVLADGGLVANTSNSATAGAAGKVTVNPSPAGAAGLTVKIVPTTGAVSGSFTHPGNNKKITFAGVVFQKTEQAAGFFLYTPAGATALSGAFGIARQSND